MVQFMKTPTQKPLLAFHNDPAIKRKYIRRVQAHRKADEIIKGQYWVGGKGCAVGCTIHASNHVNYETELGIPRRLARLEDCLFEQLPNGVALEWPLRFLKAAKTGSNLSRVADHFLHWLMIDQTDGVIRFAKSDKSKAAIQQVGELYLKQSKGEPVSQSEWRDAAAAAASDAAAYAAYAAAAAADAAAYAAADAAYAAAAASNAADAAYVAYSASNAAAYADAAASDAADAAYAAAYAASNAADAAYAAAAKSKYVVRMADKLIELIEAA